MRNAQYFLIGLLVGLPSLLTALVCSLVAAIRWKHHPKISLLTIVSLLWLALHSLVFEALFFFVPQLLIDQDMGTSLDTFYTLTSLSYNIMSALALAVLLMAVFSQRTPAQRTV